MFGRGAESSDKRVRATVYVWGSRDRKNRGGTLGPGWRSEVKSLSGRWAIWLGGGRTSCSLMNIKVIIAHDGSSSPGLYISHTGAEGAPCSGQKHPGHLASLKGAEDKNRGTAMSHEVLNPEKCKTKSGRSVNILYFRGCLCKICVCLCDVCFGVRVGSGSWSSVDIRLYF